MRTTMLSLIHKDPTLVAKGTPEVTARRERLTRVVKIVFGVASAICVIALGRVTLASASPAEEPAPAAATARAGDDEHRAARALEVDTAKAAPPPAPRGAVKAAPPNGPHVSKAAPGRSARR